MNLAIFMACAIGAVTSVLMGEWMPLPWIACCVIQQMTIQTANQTIRRMR